MQIKDLEEIMSSSVLFLNHWLVYALSEQLKFTFSNIDTLSFTETPILQSTIMNYVFSLTMQYDFLYMLSGPWRRCFCSFLQAVGSDRD